MIYISGQKKVHKQVYLTKKIIQNFNDIINRLGCVFFFPLGLMVLDTGMRKCLLFALITIISCWATVRYYQKYFHYLLQATPAFGGSKFLKHI